MFNKQPFTIYNASAGSGKTFTLVKEYLKILIVSNNPEQFKHILALTFTNKAVGEMKERIIEMLTLFSEASIIQNPNSMFQALVEELNIQPRNLHLKSEKILNSILYNYAAFDISTIDRFTHKIIRTFAYDLRLPLNFEVELDQETILNEAVDNLIAKAGIDNSLTKVLVDFAVEKVDEDKSWDIAYDFNKIAKLLVNENDIKHIDKLKNKSLEDFKVLKNQIKSDITIIENQIQNVASDTLAFIDTCGLQFDDFSRGSIPKYFENLSLKQFPIKYDANWQTNLINHETLYPKRVSSEIASTIDNIQPKLIEVFLQTKQLVFQHKFLRAFYKNITPLSVLNAINKELTTIKQEQNKLLISEFNTIISNKIKGQPTPFIYERLGEKFRHYFIDEFQDTSKLQWENLIPLISNSLSGENLKQERGTAMLVGDAKQAIYRWRGGEAEQFMNLFLKKTSPFQIDQHVENLPTNYRSFQEIIHFNNSFFSYLSDTFFGNTNDIELYKEGANQNTYLKEKGYIQLDFLNLQDENKDIAYPQKVYETIRQCKANGFDYKDVCVLVRKQKGGIAIAEYLNTEEVPITSSETMLIFGSQEVQFIDHILQLLVQPDKQEVKIKVLYYLAEQFAIKDKHAFFDSLLNLSLAHLFKQLEHYSIYIDNKQLVQLPLYETVETIIRAFKLVKNSNAFIQFYLDFVLEYSQRNDASISGFLAYSNQKKESLSIVSPKGLNAVQIMTIHKSKGLEFPVVIFPYADLEIYRELEAKEWFPLQEENFNGFSTTLLNYNKEDFKNYGEIGLDIYKQHESNLELDNINLLYVALTRPIEQLYIISKSNVSAKDLTNPKSFASLFINYLKQKQTWNDNLSSYSFGDPKRLKTKELPNKELQNQDYFISTSKESHNIQIITKAGYLWNSNQEKAIEKGNLIHDILSHIKTKEDISFAITHFIDTAIIDASQAIALKKTITQIVEHPKLKPYFTSDNIIYNERDIIATNQQIIRPDRLVIMPNNNAVIIDYKTGVSDTKHQKQLIDYQKIIEEMAFTVTHKILVYINDAIQVIIF